MASRFGMLLLGLLPLAGAVVLGGCNSQDTKTDANGFAAAAGASPERTDALSRANADSSAATEVPPAIARACTALAVDRGGFVPVQGATLGEIIQPALQGYATRWERSPEGYIVRGEKSDQLTGDQKTIAIELELRDRPITGVTYCGPGVVTILRGLINDQELSASQVGQFVFGRFSVTPRFREIEEHGQATNGAAPTEPASLRNTQTGTPPGTRSQFACRGPYSNVDFSDESGDGSGTFVRIDDNGNVRMVFWEGGQSVAKVTTTSRSAETLNLRIGFPDEPMQVATGTLSCRGGAVDFVSGELGHDERLPRISEAAAKKLQ